MDQFEFGQYIKSLREKKGLTLQELARLSSTSHPYLSQIENGKKGMPSVKILKKIAEPLEVDDMELLVNAGYFTELEVEQRNEYRKMTEESFLNWRYEGLGENLDLLTLLNQNNPVYYKGEKLSDSEKARILDMLKILFPEKY